MKKSLLIVLFCGSLLFNGRSVLAQDNRIGIGAIINSPTGVSAKAWFNENLAVDGALSFTLAENVSQVYFHSDILQHGDAVNHKLLQNYYGLGVRLLWSDISNNLTAGLRGPIGMAYSFENTSIESFFEIAPTLDFIPDARFFFGGAVGMRIYLN
jgi:hypothetical protein